MKSFLQRWAINTLAVAVAANVVRGIHYDNWVGLVLASLLLGILNTFLRPILLLLSLPLLLVTLGLFLLIINATLLYFVGNILQSFRVESFGAAFWGALIISLVSMAMNALLGTNANRPERKAEEVSRRKRVDESGNGPVIDV